MINFYIVFFILIGFFNMQRTLQTLFTLGLKLMCHVKIRLILQLAITAALCALYMDINFVQLTLIINIHVYL